MLACHDQASQHRFGPQRAARSIRSTGAPNTEYGIPEVPQNDLTPSSFRKSLLTTDLSEISRMGSTRRACKRTEEAGYSRSNFQFRILLRYRRIERF
jgi:hypothetical protein